MLRLLADENFNGDSRLHERSKRNGLVERFIYLFEN